MGEPVLRDEEADQLIIQLLKDEYVAHAGAIYVPAKIDTLLLRCDGARPHMARATLQRFGPHSVVASFTVYDAVGAPIAVVKVARFRSVRVRKNAADRLRYLDYHGIPKPHPQSPVTAPRRLHLQLQRKFSDLAHAAHGLDSYRRYTSEIEPLLTWITSVRRKYSASSRRQSCGKRRSLSFFSKGT